MDYASLQTTIASWLARNDLTTTIPTLIELAEARFRRELKSWLKTTYENNSIADDLVLPSTVDTVLSVSYNDGPGGTYNHPLDLITETDFQYRMSANPAVSAPARACWVDRDEDQGTTTLHFWPPVSASSPISNLKVSYIKALPSLSDSVTTNALLEEAEDVYLYGALAEAAPFLEHDERLPMWEERVFSGIKGLNIQAQRRRNGGAPRPIRLKRVF